MAVLIRVLFYVLAVYLVARLVQRVFLQYRSAPPPPSRAQKTQSPYEILELTPPASKEEIKKAYKQILSKYHPDKVEHLGEDIKQLAREKVQAINKAYDTLIEY